MKSREFKKSYHPSLGRYVYEHRGNGLIVDNIMKPLKGAISAAANKAGRAVAKAIGKKASKTAKAAAEKNLIVLFLIQSIKQVFQIYGSILLMD